MTPDERAEQYIKSYMRGEVILNEQTLAVAFCAERDETLEQAARVAEYVVADENWHTMYRNAGFVIADSIRALKDNVDAATASAHSSAAR